MDTNSTLEILRMARELVINEYTDKRAQIHNAWVSESEQVWATNKVKLPYPPIPPYPTEDVIVARAQKLFAFIQNPTEVTTAPTQDQQPHVTEEPKPKIALQSIPQTADEWSTKRVEEIDGDWTSKPRY